MPELLQRPPMQPGEWWDGYVIRVLAANGLMPTGYMLAKLEHYVEELVTSDVKQASLAGNHAGDGLSNFSRDVLPSWAVRPQSSATAYCTECFRDSPYIRLGWRLRGATRCAVHGHVLRVKCWSCNRRVSHRDLISGRCTCGSEYINAPTLDATNTPALSKWARPTRRARASKACSTDTCMSLTANAGGGFDSQHVALVTFLGCLLSSLAVTDRTGKKQSDGTVSSLLRHLDLKVEPTLEWVETLWERLDCATHLRCALGVVLTLRNDEKSAPSLLSTLPLWEWAQTLCRRGASPMFAERRGWISKGELAQALIPAGTVMQLTRLSGRHLRDLMSEGVVVPVRTLTFGPRQHLFSMDQIDVLKSHALQGYRYGKSVDLGIEGDGLQVMTAAKVVGITTGSTGRSWLDRQELCRLLEDLSARAVQMEEVHNSRISLGSRRIWQRPFLPVLKLMVDQLRNGKLNLWVHGGAAGLARFYIGPDSLALLHRFAYAGWSEAEETQIINTKLPLHGGEMKWRLARQQGIRRAYVREPKTLCPAWKQVVLPLEAAGHEVS